jgi:hypothetical protein
VDQFSLFLASVHDLNRSASEPVDGLNIMCCRNRDAAKLHTFEFICLSSPTGQLARQLQ